MKKGFTCLLFTFILIAAPSAIKAQGLTQSINNLTTKLLSTNQPSPADTILSITSQVLSPLDPKNSDASAKLESVVTTLESKVVTNVPQVVTIPTANVEQPTGTIINNETSNEPAAPPAQQPVSVKPANPAGETPVNSQQSNNQSSGINIGLNLPVVGNTNLTLLSGENSAEQQLSTGNAAGLKITNSPLLGNVNLGVLPAGSLSGLGITNSALLGNVNLEVLPKEDLAGLVVTNSPLLGNLNLAVLPNDNGTTSSGGLLTIDAENLLGNLPVGTNNVTGNTQNGQGGLIDLVDSLLGNVNSTLNQVINSVIQDINTEFIQINLDIPLLNDPVLGGILNPQKETTDGSSNSPPGETPSGGNGTAGNNPPVTDPAEANSGIQVPSKQEDVTSSDAVLPAETSKTVIAEMAFEQSAVNIDGNFETEQNTLADFIEKQTGHMTRQSQAEPEDVIDSVGNDSANIPVQIESPTGSTTSTGSGSGSGAGGSSSSSGGSGMSAYFGSDLSNELALSNKVQFVLKELSDDWTKAPLIQPPKAFFFLSV